ncbi:MAG: glucose-1-phosphate adenylyltransferase [Nitrospirae bacterium]|nr:glucose-1-phosphate adenylyltransferase [Nitrospirota bacterium]MBI3593351.1 glucose-1-phosphate adenylyltransferase [Nitrospirota bacterium]
MVEKTLTFILAGGTGSRLFPLTSDRAKPAVPFGGIYRIIDFTLSNCLHSGLRRILILTQYKSHSLQKHVRDGWAIFNPEINEFITTVPAQMRIGEGWYAGTADAINQNRFLLERSDADFVLILAGDHIYRMDYARMLEEHVRRNLDVTVGTVPVPVSEGRSFGVLETDDQNRIRRFYEKSGELHPMRGDPTQALASMGIYIFNRKFLLSILDKSSKVSPPWNDFGKDILPSIVATNSVGAYRFGGMADRIIQDGYWRDVGSLDAYYEANMDLLKPMPPLNLYQKDWPIRTYHGQYPPARNVASPTGEPVSGTNTLLSGGDLIVGARISHSILGPDVWVEDGAVIEDSILFSGVRVKAGAQLKRCIIEKGVVIPSNEKIGWDLEKDKKNYAVSENGVVVVPIGSRCERNLEERVEWKN